MRKLLYGAIQTDRRGTKIVTRDANNEVSVHAVSIDLDAEIEMREDRALVYVTIKAYETGETLVALTYKHYCGVTITHPITPKTYCTSCIIEHYSHIVENFENLKTLVADNPTFLAWVLNSTTAEAQVPCVKCGRKLSE